MPRSPFGFVLPLLLSFAVAAPLSLTPLEAAAKTKTATKATVHKASAKKKGHKAGKAAVAGFHPVHASVLMDAKTGRVLESSNADTTTYPASLTKMMTLLLAFEAVERGALRLDQELPVSRNACNQKPSRLGVVPGGTIRVEDAILALTVKSANDVAVVLAEALGGSEQAFAEKMNAKAQALGMTGTTFKNASGLPNREQRTTARDMARLARAVTLLPPRYYAMFGRTSFTWNDTVVAGHNRLIGKVEGYDGIKTGFVNASGFNLAGSASRDGQRLIAVVLGGSTASVRDREVADLLEKGFRTTKDTVAAR
ncbi:D-alanyl-D-alanine carboxypeptidase family protein [Azospirillum sp. TSO22-1]|uniref:D-alanyl-D-alanine carboxypeptidase family protein n=1 Tax=Azospirillum sp. TSO22-1 TaxID=716789 RepID=UPI000D651AF3|nr:D-alanyl-D-alanine carboxypeptidase family protein [Azospirillum sp. TSO22-1]